MGNTVTTCDDGGQKDQCVIIDPGTTVTFPIQYPGQDPEQYKRDGGLPVNVSRPAVYTPEETAYAGQPKSLSGLQWSESQVQKGTEVTLSCATSGVKDGANVMFSIFPEGADPEVDPPVMELRGKNKGDRAEVKWVARDIRKPEDEGAMKWFFTAWTLYCQKETSGLVRVLNPRVNQIEWEKNAVFWGNEAKLVINSFELSETSPTYTVELWEQDVSDPEDFIGSMNITFDKDEMEINYTLDIDPSLVSDFNREEEYQLYCKILYNSGKLIANSPLCEMHDDY